MDFVWADHAATVLDQLRQQRSQRHLCDVTIRADDHVISAHRCVVAACSEYFRTLFRSEFGDQAAEEYTIPGVQGETVERVVDFMYTGDIALTPETVEDALRAADFLCMTNLKEFCARLLLDRLDDENCLQIKYLAYQYSLCDMEAEVDEFLSCRFATLIDKLETYDLPFRLILSLLNNAKFNYVREQDILEFTKRWYGVQSGGASEDGQEVVEEQYRALLALIDLDMLTDECVRREVQEDAEVWGRLGGDTRAATERRLQTPAGPHTDPTEEVVVCRSRASTLGDRVHVLAYSVRADRWGALRCPPDLRNWDGLESLVAHRGALYFLLSCTGDICGYLHHSEETRRLWRLDVRATTWTAMPPPTQVHGHCRLISHTNGLYVIDRYGCLEELDETTEKWLPSTAPGFEENPSSTLYVLPMSADRYLYVLRAYPVGHSYRYCQTNLVLTRYDTVRHAWDYISDIDACDLDLEEHERFHGYVVVPNALRLRDELGHVRAQIELTNRNWTATGRCEAAHASRPGFVQEVWGSVEVGARVYFVARLKGDTSTFMLYDHTRRRYKSLAPSPACLSGLMCVTHVPQGALHGLLRHSPEGQPCVTQKSDQI